MRWPVSISIDTFKNAIAKEEICFQGNSENHRQQKCIFLDQVPDDFSSIEKGLITLNGNGSHSITNKALSLVKDAKQLKISHYKLTKIPQALFQIPLRELYFENCKIKDPFGQWNLFDQLNKLNFNRGKLPLIPSSIFAIRHLEELQITNMKHFGPKELSNDINVAANLKLLNLSNNQINSIPEIWDGSKKLIKLDLSKNRIEKLPDFLPEPLQEVNLSQNELNSIPNNVADLVHLRHLNISSNPRIFNPPKRIFRNDQLEYFNATGTRMNRVEKSIFRAKNLKVLILPKTLEFLPTEILQLSNLQELTLPSRSLFFIKEPDHVLPNLKLLNILDEHLNEKNQETIISSWKSLIE